MKTTKKGRLRKQRKNEKSGVEKLMQCRCARQGSTGKREKKGRGVRMRTAVYVNMEGSGCAVLKKLHWSKTDPKATGYLRNAKPAGRRGRRVRALPLK